MSKKELNKVILLLGVLSALGPFSIDMYLPGFPAIAKDLNVSIADVGLSLTSYFIGISVGQLFYGPIIDRFGRKAPLLFGLSLYTVAAVICALAPTIHWLIALRAVLALGGCAGMVAGRAIVRDLFPPADTAKVFSTLMLIMGVAPLIAPTMGGLIVASLGWRYIFAFLAVISGLMLAAVYFFLPVSRQPDPSVTLRPAAVLRDYWVVLKEPAFLNYAMAGGFAIGGLFAYVAGSPFIYMDLFHFTDTQYGWLFSFNALGYIAGSQFNRLCLRTSTTARIAELSALSISIVGFLMVAGVATHSLPWIGFLTLLFLYLFALGFLTPNTSALTLEPITRNVGSASAFMGFVQLIFGALASAMVSYLHNGTALPMAGVMAFCAIASFTLLVVQKYRTSDRNVEAAA